MSRLWKWVWRQQFDPGLAAGWLVNPFFFARRGLLGALNEFFPHLTGNVLDVGCGRMPYRRFASASRYVGVDIDTPVTRAIGAADVFYDGRHLPFPNESFDAVLCSQVFEHVFTPNDFLAEIFRVLRPGGHLVLTVPFVWDEHEQPQDYARYSSFGLASVLQTAGFDAVTLRKSIADSRVLFQLANAYIYKITHSRRQWVNALAMAFLMAPINLSGLLLGSILPANRDLYLDNIALAHKPAGSHRLSG
jgi:SAM-dependent methyltransferase